MKDLLHSTSVYCESVVFQVRVHSVVERCPLNRSAESKSR